MGIVLSILLTIIVALLISHRVDKRGPIGIEVDH